MFKLFSNNKLKKYVLFIAIVIFICLFKNIAVNAEVTPLTRINDRTSISAYDVEFTDFIFIKSVKNNRYLLQIKGVVKNNSYANKKYAYVINFYDSNRKLLKQVKGQSKEVGAKKYEIERQILSSANGDTYIKDIAYYKMGIKVVDVPGTTSQPTKQPDVGNEQKGVTNQENSESEKIPSEIDEYKQYDYVIDGYDVDIIVNEDNSLDVTETITAFFNKPKHGIIRNIPIVNNIERTDGTSNTVRAKIRNVTVNNESSSSRENKNYAIKIGSSDETVIGKQVYEIKYKYILGRDKLKGKDELYYNIIGTEWDTVIGNVTYKITFPKEFDGSKAGISIGKKGTVGAENISDNVFKVEKKAISGKYSDVLMPGEGITIRTELSEGYFIVKGVMDNKINYLIFIIPIAGLIIAFILWFLFGKDDKVIVTEQFYPPEGYNSVELGMLYKGKATDEDVVSLLVYLANKGYIKIEEKEKENIFDRDTFKIVKLKPYDGNDEAEALFMEGLFEERPSLKSIRKALENGDIEEENVEEVTASDLRNHFYKYVNRIKQHVNRKEVRNDIFESNTSVKSAIVILMMIAAYLAILIIPAINYLGSYGLMSIVFPIVFFIPFIAVLFISGISKGFRAIWGGMLLFMIAIFFMSLGIFEAILSENIFMLGFVLGILCIIGMGICLKAMPKRTPFGNEVLGKIKGFKRFLETSSKDKLEAMVEENPSYFYDILPYTYVLGVSNKWIKKFETICIAAPMWYYGHDPDFNMHRFGSFMNDTMKTSNNAMSSSPSSSGSGGGGGTSGGGAGGGGGSSW